MINDTHTESLMVSLTNLADVIDPEGTVDKTELYKNSPEYVIEEAVERISENYGDSVGGKWYGTQEEYDELTEYDENTLYYIEEE